MPTPRRSNILLSGKKQSGKDTVGQYLVEKYGYTRFAFADEMKSMAVDLDPFIDFDGLNTWRLSEIVNINGWEVAKTLPEVRRFLQYLGTNAVRRRDPNFWIRTLDRKMEALPEARPFVITDCRFVNEAESGRAAGAQIWRIVRPDLASDDQHQSETELDGYESDLIIVNNGSIDDLYDHVDFALQTQEDLENA